MSSSKMFCEKKGRNRMAFQTRERANFFIEHFDDMIEGEVELRPCRSFYCPLCDRWHITHFPISPDNERFEERNQKIHSLQALVQRLKTEYRMNHWEVWKPIVEEAMETMEEFRLRPGFEKLVENTGASLENYLKLIQTAQAKADDSANADFVQMKKEIDFNAVGKNVSELGLDTDSITAALLHDTVEDCSEKTNLDADHRVADDLQAEVDELDKALENVNRRKANCSIITSLILKSNEKEGSVVTNDEWAELENYVTEMYPSFVENMFRVIPNISKEYIHIVMLLKLDFAPLQIATLLNKSMSTISNARCRMYSKAHGGDKCTTEEADRWIRGM